MVRTTTSFVYNYERPINDDVQGSIIDIETIGDFNKHQKGDSREYSNLKQTILGYISNGKLQIHCAINEQGITELATMTNAILQTLKRPFYAYQCTFESAVWFNQLGIKVHFDGELQRYKYEAKRNAITSLNIPNYKDPFLNNGLKCTQAWQSGNIKYAIAHNRACLLKERDILLKRGYRDVEPCVFVRVEGSP